MFQQLRNIDSAFKFVRLVAIISIVASVSLAFYAVYYTQRKTDERLRKVYVIANGKALEAVAQDRGLLWPIEIRDHVKMFHFYFYALTPDDKVITQNVLKSLHLADKSATSEYDNLRENGYYRSLIAASASQEVIMDSIQVDLESTPWKFTYFGKLRITRETTIVTRSLITEGQIRITQPSDDNPHGLSIDRWRVLENKDIQQSDR